MNNNERSFLEADLATLENIIANLDESQYITKLSYQNRLKQVKEKLSKLTPTVNNTLTLTFKGSPVDGSHGIFADFAAKAIGKFSDAFAAFAAVAEGRSLASKGFIPDSDKHRLLITQTAVGSFGFKLQLPTIDKTDAQQSLLPSEENYINNAKIKLETVIDEAINGDDEQLADSMTDLDPRAIDCVQAFFETLNQENAIFTINSGLRKIVCSNQEDLREAAVRLKSDNIVEDEVECVGQFVGILPENRDFEFKKNDGATIKGKIDKSIEDPDKILSDWYKKLVKVRLHTRVIGRGRPRFALRSLDMIELQRT